MASKSILRRGFKTDSEKIAEKYREELGISNFNPLDAFMLAEFLDIPIFSVEEACGSDSNSLILNDLDKFSAMWMINEDGDKIIIHNKNHSLKRQQSNLMHELAHIICNHQIPLEQARLCQLFKLHYYNKEHEEEAKHLGACLQITRNGLLWSLNQNYTESQISDYYNASLEMVKFRLNTSGVLKQRSYYH